MINDLFGSLDGFEWDKGNTYKNYLKHKVSAQESEEIFRNRPLIILPDQNHSQNKEDRYHAFGKNDLGRLLLIAFTIRDKKIRIISARPMNGKERNFYENYK